MIRRFCNLHSDHPNKSSTVFVEWMTNSYIDLKNSNSL